eukprot:jgi/Mesvir1/3901/Mv19847-RA.1
MAVSWLSNRVCAVALFIAIACVSSAVASDVSKICGEKNFFLKATASGFDTAIPEKCSLLNLWASWTAGCPLHLKSDLELKRNENDVYEALGGIFTASCMTTSNDWEMLCTTLLDVPAVGVLSSVGLVRFEAVYPSFAWSLLWGSGSRGFEGVTGTSKQRTLTLFTTFEFEFHLDKSPRCGDANQFTFAVWGDAPYGETIGDTTQINKVPAFIEAVNADESVELVTHVGDFRSGNDHCSEEYNWRVFNAWKGFAVPLVYTPGDNDWADCQKAKQGGWSYTAVTPWPCLTAPAATNCDGYYDAVADDGSHRPGDPIDNLAMLRRIFFSRPGGTLGKHKSVLSQAIAFDPAHPADGKYVENVMFAEAGVLFVAVGIPGGTNEGAENWFGAPDPRSQRQLDEVAERVGATNRWINQAFATAWEGDFKAVCLMFQADMWDLDGKPVTRLTGYKPIVQTLRNNTLAFGRPVLAIHGDSKVYKSDNPFANGPGANPYLVQNTEFETLEPVKNFHRVIIHGGTLPLEYLRVTANADAYYGYGSGPDATQFGPFTWSRHPQPSL